MEPLAMRYEKQTLLGILVGMMSEVYSSEGKMEDCIYGQF